MRRLRQLSPTPRLVWFVSGEKCTSDKGFIGKRGGDLWPSSVPELFRQPEEDRRWKDYLRNRVRVRITDVIRTAIEQEYAIPRSAPRSEERRGKILRGLTLDAWEALQEDIRNWDYSLLSVGSSELETALRQTIRKGLRKTELSRSAYDALQRLVAHRDRTQACHHLLEDLHHFDPRERLVKHSREDLTATIERVGHSLTVSSCTTSPAATSQNVLIAT